MIISVHLYDIISIAQTALEHNYKRFYSKIVIIKDYLFEIENGPVGYFIFLQIGHLFHDKTNAI